MDAAHTQSQDLLCLAHQAAALPDSRSEGDEHWLANGARVQLSGLQAAVELNGMCGQVVGFDDKTHRYRVKLDAGGPNKLVAKRNLQLTFPVAPPESMPGQHDGLLPLVQLGPRPLQQLGGAAAPTKEMVRQGIHRILRDATILQRQCMARRHGVELPGSAMSDAFLRLHMSVDAHEDTLERYCEAHGEDEELLAESARATELAESCEQYHQKLRSWGEMLQDEWNLTRYEVRKNGIVGTLRNDLTESGRAVAEIGSHASGRIAAASAQVPGMARQATGMLSGAVQHGSQVAALTAGDVLEHSQRRAHTALEEYALGPVRRAWHLLLMGFLLCFVVPLVALRAYAPLNGAVAQVGLVYAAVCLACPPCRVRRRVAKAGLLLLWPLTTVVLPQGIHYWLTHPEARSLARDWLRPPPASPPAGPQPPAPQPAFVLGLAGAGAGGRAGGRAAARRGGPPPRGGPGSAAAGRSSAPREVVGRSIPALAARPSGAPRRRGSLRGPVLDEA